MIYYCIITIILIICIIYIVKKNKLIGGGIIENFEISNPCITDKNSLVCKKSLCSLKRKQCYIDCYQNNIDSETNTTTCTTCPSDKIKKCEECNKCSEACDAKYVLCKNEAEEAENSKKADFLRNKESEEKISLYFCGEDNLVQKVLKSKHNKSFLSPVIDFAQYIDDVSALRETIYSKVESINRNTVDIFDENIINSSDFDPDSNFEKLFVTYLTWKKDKEDNLSKIDGYFKNLYSEDNQVAIDDEIFNLTEKLIYRLLFIRNSYIELSDDNNNSIINRLHKALNPI